MTEMTTEQLVKSHALAIQALEGLQLLDPNMVRRIARGGTNDKAVAKAVAEARSQALPSSIEPERSYVLGFAFNRDLTHTLLRFRNSSVRYPGLMNGFGTGVDGRLDDPLQLMRDSFARQTGIETERTTWSCFGRYGLDAVTKRQPGTYMIKLFVAVLEDDTSFETLRNADGDDVVRTPINLEVFNRKGAQGLAWMLGGALEHLRYGTTFLAEVFPMTHLVNAEDTEPARPVAE